LLQEGREYFHYIFLYIIFNENINSFTLSNRGPEECRQPFGTSVFIQKMPIKSGTIDSSQYTSPAPEIRGKAGCSGHLFPNFSDTRISKMSLCWQAAGSNAVGS
jgi:hypothetical protein